MADGDHRGGVQYAKLRGCHPSCRSFCTRMAVTIEKTVEKRKEHLQRKSGGVAGAGDVFVWVVGVVAISRYPSTMLAGLVVYLGRTLAAAQLPPMPRGVLLAAAALCAGLVVQRGTGGLPGPRGH